MTRPLQTDATRSRLRRKVTRKVPDTSIPSPCIGLCTLDNNTNLCDGCFRNIDEIREWIIMDRDEKLAVLAQLEQRRDDTIGI